MRKFGIYGLLTAVGSLALLATTAGCNNREASAAAATVASQGAVTTANLETEANGLVQIDQSVYKDPPADFNPTDSAFPAEAYQNCLLHRIDSVGAMMRYERYGITCPRGKNLTLPRSTNFLAPGEAANMEKFARYSSDPSGGLNGNSCVIGMEQPIDTDITVYEVICGGSANMLALMKSADYKIDDRLLEKGDLPM